MSHRTNGRVAAVVTAVALTGSAPTTAAHAAPSAERSSTTRVRVDQHHRIHMPSTIRAGLHTFRVRSRDADFQLLTVHGRYSKQEFADDTNKGLGGGQVWRIKRLEKHVTFLGGGEAADGHVRVQVRVPHGTFWALDTGPEKTRVSRIFVGHAVGPAKAGRPTGTATITAVDDDRWSTSDPATIPVSGTLLFRNASHANHFVVLSRLQPGKTISDFAAWVDRFKAGQATYADAPVDQQAPGFFNGILGPGRTMSDTYSLPAGSYVVACFWPDAEMGGLPHVFMGMYRGVTVG